MWDLCKAAHRIHCGAVREERSFTSKGRWWWSGLGESWRSGLTGKVDRGLRRWGDLVAWGMWIKGSPGAQGKTWRRHG